MQTSLPDRPAHKGYPGTVHFLGTITLHLYTGPPGHPVELTAGGYAPQPIRWQVDHVRFGEATEDWPHITHAGISSPGKATVVWECDPTRICAGDFVRFKTPSFSTD